MRVGVLTGGGDCPGLNAVIRAVVRKGVGEYGFDFVGFLDGWRGPLENITTELGVEQVRGILPRGGTILKSSRTNPFKVDGGVDRIRDNLAANHTISISAQRYWALGSPVARRLYRLVEVARADGRLTWRVALDQLAEQLPLAQRYPSHLQRVLQPAHDMLVAQGVLRNAAVRQHQREWFVDYMLGSRPA